MSRKLLAILTLINFLVLAGCSTTSVRQHPDMMHRLKEIQTVVVAPPEVKVEYIVLTGENQLLEDKQDIISDELISSVEVRLQQSGLEVVSFDFETAILDEDFAYQITQVREAFGAAREVLYERAVVTEDKMNTFKTSVGSGVNVVADESKADAIILMNYYGFEKSSGVIAKEMAAAVLLAALTGSMPVSNNQGGAVEIALVDGTTGDILWTNVKGAPLLNGQVANQAMEQFPQVTTETNTEETPLVTAQNKSEETM